MASIMKKNRVNAWKLNGKKQVQFLIQSRAGPLMNQSNLQSFTAMKRSAVSRLLTDARSGIEVKVDVAQYEENSR